MGLEGDSAASLRPRAWKTLPISEVFHFKQGVQVPVERQELVRKAGQVRFIRIVDLTNRTEPWRFIEDPGSMHHVAATDLFMVRYGCPGTMGIGFEGVVANNLFRLIPQRSVHSKFYYYYLSSQQGAIANISGSSTMPAINFGSFRNLVVSEPSVEEQQAIATALSDADAYIESLEKLITKKRQIKQGVMQELLTGKRRLPGFEGEWKRRKLGEISRLYQSQTISANQFTEDGYPVYGANGVVGFFSEYNHESWQVTVTCRGSTCGTVNRTVNKSWITGNAMVVNCEENADVDKQFLFYLLCQQDLTKCISGTGQPQIVRSPLAAFEVKLPSDLAEQVRIGEVLADCDLEIHTIATKLSKARLLKQAMMQQLLTGKIRLV